MHTKYLKPLLKCQFTYALILVYNWILAFVATCIIFDWMLIFDSQMPNTKCSCNNGYLGTFTSTCSSLLWIYIWYMRCPIYTTGILTCYKKVSIMLPNSKLWGIWWFQFGESSKLLSLTAAFCVLHVSVKVLTNDTKKRLPG